jgi:hypothetical protein
MDAQSCHKNTSSGFGHFISAFFGFWAFFDAAERNISKHYFLSVLRHAMMHDITK